MNRKFLFLSLAILLLAACAHVEGAASPPVTPPLTTNTPTPTRTPRPLSTPVATATFAVPAFTGEWLVPAQVVPVSGIESGEWGENSELILRFKDAYYPLVFISAGSEFQLLPPTPTPLPYDGTSQIVSPSGGFTISCSDDGGFALRNSEQELVSESAIRAPSCQLWMWAGVGWTSDESAAAFVGNEGEVYVWPTDGNPPYSIGTISPGIRTRPDWAKDNWRLAVGDRSPDQIDAATFTIFFRDGSPPIATAARFPVGDGTLAVWYREDVIAVWGGCGSGCSGQEFYHWRTGELLIGTGTERYFPFDQPPLNSDNGRWLLNPRVGEMTSGYQLYDFESRQSYWLVDWPEYEMDLLKWSETDQAFHILRVARFEEYDPTLTYGYLHFYPETRSFVWLKKHVIYAELSESYFFGISLDPDTLVLSTQIFDTDGTQVTDSYLFAPSLIETTSGPGDYRPHAWQWSNSRDRVAYVDAFGDLWLLGIDGQRVQIGAGIVDQAEPGWPVEPYLHWSPDDSHLLVVFDEYGWVLSLE